MATEPLEFLGQPALARLVLGKALRPRVPDDPCLPPAVVLSPTCTFAHLTAGEQGDGLVARHLHPRDLKVAQDKLVGCRGRRHRPGLTSAIPGLGCERYLGGVLNFPGLKFPFSLC